MQGEPINVLNASKKTKPLVTISITKNAATAVSGNPKSANTGRSTKPIPSSAAIAFRTTSTMVITHRVFSGNAFQTCSRIRLKCVPRSTLYEIATNPNHRDAWIPRSYRWVLSTRLLFRTRTSTPDRVVFAMHARIER